MNRSFPRHSVIALLGGLFQTRLYHPALAGTPPEEGNWNHFGGCSRRGSTTCIPVGVDSGLRRNDDWDGNGIVTITTAPLLPLPSSWPSASSVIPAKAGIQWFNNPFPRSGNDNRNDNE